MAHTKWHYILALKDMYDFDSKKRMAKTAHVKERTIEE